MYLDYNIQTGSKPRLPCESANFAPFWCRKWSLWLVNTVLGNFAEIWPWVLGQDYFVQGFVSVVQPDAVGIWAVCISVCRGDWRIVDVVFNFQLVAVCTGWAILRARCLQSYNSYKSKPIVIKLHTLLRLPESFMKIDALEDSRNGHHSLFTARNDRAADFRAKITVKVFKDRRSI